MKRRIIEYLALLMIAWGVPLLMAATGNPVLVKVDLEDDDWIGQSTGVYITFDDTTNQLQIRGGDVYFNDETASRLVSLDSGKLIDTVADLSTWVSSGTGITVSNDGDGTVTVAVKNQTNEAYADTSHDIFDPADSPADADALRDDLVANTIVDAEYHMDLLGTKINNILGKLEAAGIFDGP